MMFRAGTWLAVPVLAFTVEALCAPPRVVRAVPDHADSGVDPALAGIVIEFDRDMNPRGHSICGGGPAMIPITGEPSWRDARTLLIPVKLAPGSTYSFSINCPAARNFTSAQGEPADAYPISFRTAAEGEAPAAISEDDAAACTASLRTAIETRYSHRDRVVKDWDSAFSRHGESLRTARTPAEFGRSAARLLAEADDLHTFVRVGEFTISAGRRSVTPNVDARALPRNVPGHSQIAPGVFTGQFGDAESGSTRIGYIAISSWALPRESIDAAARAVQGIAAKGVERLVVDVRTNAGGDELLARRIAGLFLDQPAVYSRNRTRDPAAPEGWTRMFDRVVEPAPKEERFGGRVAVLMGPANMSSCESFLLMMKQSPRARLFGERTYGSSGNPTEVALPCGVTVVLSSWEDFTADGEPIEGVGVSPDVVVRQESSREDHVLNAAIKWLRE